ncbi:hypothetical protein LAD67_13060 [Escherichia coli]|nr:hypothetical protein [Escherichia coli]
MLTEGVSPCAILVTIADPVLVCHMRGDFKDHILLGQMCAWRAAQHLPPFVR